MSSRNAFVWNASRVTGLTRLMRQTGKDEGMKHKTVREYDLTKMVLACVATYNTFSVSDVIADEQKQFDDFIASVQVLLTTAKRFKTQQRIVSFFLPPCMLL